MNIREVELDDLPEIRRLRREWRQEEITIGFRSMVLLRSTEGEANGRQKRG